MRQPLIRCVFPVHKGESYPAEALDGNGNQTVNARTSFRIGGAIPAEGTQKRLGGCGDEARRSLIDHCFRLC